MPLLTLQVPTPVGPLTLIEKDRALVALDWSTAGSFLGTPLLQAMAQQLYQYFNGERRDFEFPVAPVCTPLEHRVFLALRQIPFGQTRGYSDIARQTDSETQAVIEACRSNPIPLVIPCHRVIDDDGDLGLFEAPDGLQTKEFLLRLEGAPLARTAPAAATA